MAGNFRRLDAFIKTRNDLQQKSAVGGFITLIASSTAFVLFLGTLYSYVVGNAHHSLRLSRSVSFPLVPIPVFQHNRNRRKHPSRSGPSSSGMSLADQLKMLQGKISLSFHVTFTNLLCDQLDILQDGASHRAGELNLGAKSGTRQFITMRKPTPQERAIAKMDPHATESGCTIEGFLRPPQVAGSFQITVSQQAWMQASALVSMLQSFNPERVAVEMQKYNVSHYIHKIEFGKTWSRSLVKPLENHEHVIQNEYGGIAVEQIVVRLVPTMSQGFLFRESSYQQSVAEHTIQPEALMAHGMQYLPGLVISYDFVPLTVYHDEGRDNLLIFIANLISIVAGVFVTVGLVTGCFVHTVSEVVAKKID